MTAPRLPRPGDRIVWRPSGSGYIPDLPDESATIVRVTPTGSLRDDGGRLWKPQPPNRHLGMRYKTGGGHVRRFGYTATYGTVEYVEEEP